MKSLATWKLISSSLKRDIPVMLLYVVQSAGSSPGRQGFSMAVNAAGEMDGSLGGGIMEHKFVELAKSRLSDDIEETSIHKQIHNKTAPTHQSGMICSGEQTILLHTVQSKDALSIEAMIACFEQNETGLFNLSPLGIGFEPGGNKNLQTDYSFISVEDWKYHEVIGFKNYLFIIGAGHCSLALSRIMQQLDFYIQLYDDRKDLKTMQENNFVHKKELLDDYQQLGELMESGNNSYVVVMTFGYRTDGIALRALINKEFKYLGLLGSKAKTKKMMADLLSEGFDASVLDRIHAPVGISIKSETPEEVAISIAAEIISIKNSLNH